jgi:hypothetical protein
VSIVEELAAKMSPRPKLFVLSPAKYTELLLVARSHMRFTQPSQEIMTLSFMDVPVVMSRPGMFCRNCGAPAESPSCSYCATPAEFVEVR